ncbi:hypothetical protein [Bacillus subtilis]|uniref:Uncharacterized protein n=1 Tax=Bacillus subtilis subsp. subtilis TaxID=135461 RepID=A0ABD3ZQA5_BACIU|nr:hypothetical protein [Bacillus subtilis]KIL30398.1 hypothetical protein B4067_1332 [Bacillus subtilis subsp. subtilis]KIN49306.1 hypothetical protein B4145_1270 [Bacillus subtilis]
MADKRVSIKTVQIDHGNDVVESIAVRGEEETADILRAALASVEAPTIEVTKDSKTEITATLNVEVSEAITGLKALQREAKAATKALAELREERRDLNIEGVAEVLGKFLESPKVDTLKLKDALGILTPTERHRLIHEDVRGSRKAENTGGEL